MQLRISLWTFIILSIVAPTVPAQIDTFPYSEGFDNTIAPNLPSGWSASGFVDTGSTPRSLPNCILAKGNTVAKTLITPVFDFTNRVPDKLIFYEYRSGTAKYYRLEIRVSTDGINFDTLIAQYDSITALSSFIPRVINLSGAGLQGQAYVNIQWQLFGDNLNNTGVLRIDDVSLTVGTGYKKCDLLINEIMYEPLDGQNEWLELMNRSSESIDIAQWTFNSKATSSGVNSFIITNQTSIVKSGEYIIAAADSSIFQLFPNIAQSDNTSQTFVLNRPGGFSLNNDGDAVVLKDPTGQTIDSVAYIPGWHHPDVVDTRGRSLERINPNVDSNDPRNWSTCTNLLGGTPGKANSIIATCNISNSRISISPNPFSPDNDGFEDFCIIHYNLSLAISTLNVKIFDIKGRLVRILANGELAGSQGEIIWNGLDDKKQRTRIGVYIVYLEAIDRASGRVETGKAVAVVATKL
jgi:hypothetical protein